MEDGNDDCDGYAEYRDTLRSFMSIQCRLVDISIRAITTGDGSVDREKINNDREVIEVISLLIQGMGSSCHSILRLTEELDLPLRDCFGISRSICESAINIAYIMAGGKEFALKAQRHAAQKSFRDLQREANLGGYAFTLKKLGTIPDPENIPELKEALSEFTNKKGKEKRDWCDDSIEEKLAIIHRKFGSNSLDFSASMFSIYRHSSEILHGTYYGNIYFLTAGQKKAETKEELHHMLLANHFVSIFTATYFGMNGVVDLLAKEYKIQALKEANDELFKTVKKYCLERLANIPSPNT